MKTSEHGTAARPPADWLRFVWGDWALGWLSPARAVLLCQVLPTARRDGEKLILPAGTDLQALAETLRARGAIGGWRDEAYAGEAPVADPCQTRGAELFRLERAAFRGFGLMSRAVHINGWLPDGRMLCGRRALHKATDPGRLDNLAAGGLSAGEDLLACARRELWEEAGVPAALTAALRPAGVLRTRREVAEGWHDEVLHVYELPLPAGFEPRNQDGEVAEFLALSRAELAARLGEFSPDAAAVVRLGLN